MYIMHNTIRHLVDKIIFCPTPIFYYIRKTMDLHKSVFIFSYYLTYCKFA